MGASTSLRRRISCAGGSSCTASSELRTRTARGLAQTPRGTANAVIFHPTPNLPLNQNHGRTQMQADSFHRSATSSTRAEMKRSQGLQTKGHVLVTDCGFRSPLRCWVPSARSANTSKNTQREDPWKWKSIIAIKMRRSAGKWHAATLKTENYWAKKRETKSCCGSCAVPLLTEPYCCCQAPGRVALC